MSSNASSLTQVKETLEIFYQHGINFDDMRFLHDGTLSDVLEAVKLSRGTCFPSRNELRVFLGLLPLFPTIPVDYDKPVEAMISDGNYDSVCLGSPHIIDPAEYIQNCNVRKARNGAGIFKIQLIEIPEGGISLEKNEAEGQAGKNYRLASFEEVLAFGATFPKVQQRCRSIYGMAYKGRDFHPHLWASDSGSRGLSLSAGGMYSNPNTHFLYVER